MIDTKTPFILFLLYLVAIIPSAYALEDGELWLSADINFYKANKSKWYFYMETRSSDSGSDLRQYYFGPRYNYQLSHGWSVGGALKSVNLKRDEDFDNLYRFEIEAIYADSFGNKGKLDFRNRLENIVEDGRDNTLRYRPRIRYRYPLENHLFSTVYFSQELIYASTDNRWQLSQSRFVPFGLSIKTGKRSSFNLFYQYQTKLRNEREDDKIHVLGVSFNY